VSLKPPKKSDLDKNWMKARRDRPKKSSQNITSSLQKVRIQNLHISVQ